MTLYELHLRWWGRGKRPTIRHYSAADVRDAIRMAQEDHHEVLSVRSGDGRQLLWKDK